MAAEIYENDGAVFAGSTWHGLGKYVGDTLDPREAMRIAGLDWTVAKTPVYASYNNESIYDADYAAIVREDNNKILSIQSSDYQVVQNSEVFELAYALSDTVKVESAFTMGNGRKLVVLLKSGSFITTKDSEDEVDEYLALLTSHDGTIALSGLPTSVRIVCANTLNMAFADARRKKKQMFRVTHSGNMQDKLDDMRDALKQYAETAKFFRETVKTLGSRTMTRDEIQKFWLDVWGMIETPVVSNPQTDEESKNYREAVAAIASWSETFDTEREQLNLTPNLWTAANAATKWIQHKNPARGRKPTSENRAYNNLLGKQQDLTVDVMQSALALV
jgi:phage/plasmid-like protein (TIGR03299 family)